MVTMRRVLGMAVLLFLVSCGKPETPEVRVHAASSLVDVMERIGREYEAATGVKVRLNFASSSTLARQIVEGAPGDVFISADPEWADFVEAKGRAVPGTRVDLLGNEIGFAWRIEDGCGFLSMATELPRDAPYWVKMHLDANPVGRIAMGDPSHVPAGRYAREALRASGLWERVEPLAIYCDSVRSALGLFQSGEVLGAFLYSSDLPGSGARGQHRFPEGISPTILYPALLLTPGRSDGRAFLFHLRSKEAGAIFVGAGFLLPESPR